MADNSIPIIDYTPPKYTGQPYQVDPVARRPIVPGSPYGPPQPTSPSDIYGVANPIEQITPLNFIPGFVGNLAHQFWNMGVGLTHLGKFFLHDLGKSITAVIPGQQALDTQDWAVKQQFLVPMLGIGSAKSALWDDYHYRYGSIGKFLRGLYEQPLSFAGDAFMVGGWAGKAAKASAMSGEYKFLTETVGISDDAIRASQAEAAFLRDRGHAEKFINTITDEQRAQIAKYERPESLTRAMKFANLEASDVLGGMRPQTIRMPVGSGQTMFELQLPSNPVTAMFKRYIYDNPIVTRNFGKMDEALRASLGNNNKFGFDALVNMTPYELEDAFRAIGDTDKIAQARTIFATMKRMVEVSSEKGDLAVKYNKAFQPWSARLYEGHLFRNFRSSMMAVAVTRRKGVIDIFSGNAEDVYNALRPNWPEGYADDAFRAEADQMIVRTLQGEIESADTAMAVDSIRQSLNEVRARHGMPPLEATPVVPIPDVPPEWRNVTGRMPESPLANLQRADDVPPQYPKPVWEAIYDAVMQDGSPTVEGFLKKAQQRMKQASPVTPWSFRINGVRRSMLVVDVASMHDIMPTFQKILERTGGTMEYMSDTLNRALGLGDETNFVRARVGGIRLPDGNLVEVAPMTRQMLGSATAVSDFIPRYQQFLQKLDRFITPQEEGRMSILAGKYKRVQDMFEAMREWKRAANNPNHPFREGGKITAGSARGKADQLERIYINSQKSYQKALEEAMAMQEEVGASVAFMHSLNEGVDNALQYGEDYSAVLKFRDRTIVDWVNNVIAREISGTEGHFASLSPRTMLNRAYAPQRITKVMGWYGKLINDLERFLQGDLPTDILNMSRQDRIKFAQFVGLSENSGARFAVVSGDAAEIARVFGGTEAFPVGYDQLAFRLAAFLHSYTGFPSAEVESMVNRVMRGLPATPPKGEYIPAGIPLHRDIHKALQESLKTTSEFEDTGAVRSVLSTETSVHGERTMNWTGEGSVVNAPGMARALGRIIYHKIGAAMESGDVEGFRWSDFHREWRHVKGQPTPIYFPHIVAPEPGRMVMSGPNRLAQLHPRDNWLKSWDGELMKQGIVDTNFFEAYSHKAVELIRHQEVAELFKQAERFSRDVTEAELDLWRMNKMRGEKLWNPTLVDMSFSMLKMGRSIVFDKIAEGKTLEQATSEMLHDMMPEMVERSFRAVSGDIKAVPTYIADAIEKQSRLNFGWGLRVTYDSAMQVWRSSVLALSPRWLLNNLFGNAFFQMVKDPAAIIETVKMLEPKYRHMWEYLAGGSMPEEVARGLFFEQGNILENPLGKYGYAEQAAPEWTDMMKRTMATAPAQRMSRIANYSRDLQGIIEDTSRTATFASGYKRAFREAMMSEGKSWADSANALERIMESGSLNDEILAKTIDHVNKVLGNYTNLNAFERQVIRRFVSPFYAFYRHAVKFALSSITENPAKVQILRVLDNLDREMEGDLPDYMRGSIMVGHLANGDPLWIRTKNFNPLEALSPTSSGLIQYLTPLLRVAVERSLGISALSGKPFASEDTFQTPTGHRYMYVRDPETGDVTGVRAMDPNEHVLPPWWEHFASMFPQFNLLADAYRSATGQGGAQYSAGGTIMKDGKPAYPNPWYSGLMSYLGVPTTTFDPNEYLYNEYKDYWKTAWPMARNRSAEITGVQP